MTLCQNRWIFPKELLPVKTPTGAGEKCDAEGAAEMKCYELTTTPIPHPPVLFGGKKSKKLGVKE